jgi:hypothetical protein
MDARIVATNNNVGELANRVGNIEQILDGTFCCQLAGRTAEGPRPAPVPDVSPLLVSEPRFLRSLWQMCAEESGGGTIRWGKNAC